MVHIHHQREVDAVRGQFRILNRAKDTFDVLYPNLVEVFFQ